MAPQVAVTAPVVGPEKDEEVDTLCRDCRRTGVLLCHNFRPTMASGSWGGLWIGYCRDCCDCQTLTPQDIDHADLCKALHQGQTKVTPHYKRVEFEGHMTEVAQRSIMRWLDQHGATGSNPYNRRLQSGSLTITITCQGWGGQTSIELVEEAWSAQPVRTQVSSMLTVGGVA